MIEVKNLKKHYGQTRAVDGVSFSMKKGEILGLLGPNGAGKSTTMKVITCYLPFDEGKVEVAGHDVESEPLEVRRRLGYLPENTPLFEEMGVIEFLHFIGEIRGIPRKERKDRIRKTVKRTGLEGVVGKTIGQLSRGYRQRVGLAQALIHDPDILVLDEPTSALDPSQIKEIRDLIREIGKEKSIILSTHIMQEVTATCDRAIIIYQGRVIAEGTPDELIGRGHAEKLVSAVIQGPADDVSAALKAIDGVKSVRMKPAGDDGNWNRFMLAGAKSSDDLAVRVFRAAGDKGWLLRELIEEKASLEDVFIQLTTDAKKGNSNKNKSEDEE